jgi:hypothetical protein
VITEVRIKTQQYEQLKKVIDQNKDMPANFRVGEEEIKKKIAACEYIPPMILQHVWHTYWELRARTDRAHPISFQEIESYLRLLQEDMLKWEIQLLSALDNDFIKIMNSKD